MTKPFTEEEIARITRGMTPLGDPHYQHKEVKRICLECGVEVGSDPIKCPDPMCYLLQSGLREAAEVFFRTKGEGREE